ncbi:hypothetical protein CEXT_712451 [Caerostris extrusa]|uniref:Uncharacterized protein n=1 Tax=Caerostris extrusa TaxID=172846 RepID=A0AAV4U4D3_CAEEX|nr:hypothetical protein CEXT_712451 [Caerostris extrusa]
MWFDEVTAPSSRTNDILAKGSCLLIIQNIKPLKSPPIILSSRMLPALAKDPKAKLSRSMLLEHRASRGAGYICSSQAPSSTLWFAL